MATVRDILEEKGRHLNSVSPQASIHTAAVLMNDQKIGSLLVMEEGRLIGILTERDILMRVVAEQRDATTCPVEAVMTRDVVCCQPATTLEEAGSVMKHRRVRHLPVLVEEDRVGGLISIGDLNAYQVNHHEKTIHLLQSYIQGHA